MRLPRPWEGENAAPRRESASGDDLSAMGRGGLLNLGGAGVYAVVAFVIVLVVARKFEAGQAGVFFQASALFLIVSNICELGADTGLVWTIPRYRLLGRTRDIRRVVWIGVLPGTMLAALAAAALFALAPQLAGVLTQARYESVFAHDLRLLVPFLPASVALTLFLSATRGLGRMTPAVVLDKLCRPVLQLSAIFVVIFLGLGIGWVALAWVAPFIVATVPAVFWLASLIRQAERGDGPPAESGETGEPIASEFWRFSLPRALAASLKVGVDKLDIVLVGSLASARAAGIYAAGTRLLIVGTMASVAISQALGPTISRHFAGRSVDQAKSAFQTAAAWGTLLTWPLYLQLMVFAPVILRVFGGQYDEASAAVMIIAGAFLVANIVGPVDLVLLMGGRSLSSMGNMAVGLFVNVTLNILLVPPFGLTGAGVSWAASLLVMNLMPLRQVWRHQFLHPFGAGTLQAAAAGTVCFGILPLLVRLGVGLTVPGWVASGVAGSALYAWFCWRQRHVLHLSDLTGVIRKPSGTARGDRPRRDAALPLEPAPQSVTQGV